MKAVSTHVEQLYQSGRRLDASYHASDGVKALRFILQWGGLSAWPAKPAPGRTREKVRIAYGTRRLDPLEEVCVPEGVFIPSRFKRVFVDDRDHGAPYLTGGSIMQLDPLMGAKMLSYRFTHNMDELALQERMILVTCSGTIGNSVYVNANFKDAVGSPDLLRIVADPAKIPPGCLYAYLSSPLGKALVEQKTYGAVVPHIEAHHVTDLPIPRLEPATEQRIHDLTEQAAALRVEANKVLEEAKQSIHVEVGFTAPTKEFDHEFAVASAPIDRAFSFRLDSFCYVGYAAEAAQALHSYGGRVVRTSSVGFRIYNPPLFKRMFAQNGYPYMSGVEIYTLRPRTNRLLSRLQPGVEQYLVSEGMILIQSAGQRYGLITTPVLVTRMLDGVAATSDIVRVVHEDRVENGFFCALLLSDFGRRLALRYSYGTSIPRLNVPEFSRIRIPWPREEIRRAIGRSTVRAYEMRDRANELEDQAQLLLAKALGREAQLSGRI
jgi:type I restriction enzyme S subunit